MAFIIRRLAHLHWIATFLSPMAVILFEVLWVYSWLVWAGEWSWLDWHRPLLSLPSLILLVGISFFITRYLLSRRRSLQWLQVAIILSVIFGVIRLEYGAGFGLLDGEWFGYTLQLLLDSFAHPQTIILGIIASVYLSWRGIRLGHSSLDFRDVYRSFLVGLTALIMLIVLWGVTRGAGSLKSLTSAVGFQVVGFFFFGLMALALVNLQAIRRRILLGEMEPLSNTRWVTILFGVVGGIVLLGAGITSIFSSDFVTSLGRLLSSALDLVSQAVGYLLIPFGFLAEVVIYVVQFIIDLISGGEQQPFQTPSFFEPAILPETVVPDPLFLDITLVLKWTFFGLAAAAVVFLLIKAVSRFRSLQGPRETEIEEISESLWSWPAFKADVLQFVRGVFRNWQRKKAVPAQVIPVPGGQVTGDADDLLNVRQIYQQLLWEAATFRIQRQRQETPNEYASRLSHIVPAGSEQLRELTDLYINSRYGDTEAKHKQIEQANSLWRNLGRLIRGPERTNQVE